MNDINQYKLLNNKQSKITTQQHNHYHLKLVSFCLLESNLHISEMNYVWRWFFHSAVFSKIFFFTWHPLQMVNCFVETSPKKYFIMFFSLISKCLRIEKRFIVEIVIYLFSQWSFSSLWVSMSVSHFNRIVLSSRKLN